MSAWHTYDCSVDREIQKAIEEYDRDKSAVSGSSSTRSLMNYDNWKGVSNPTPRFLDTFTKDNVLYSDPITGTGLVTGNYRTISTSPTVPFNSRGSSGSFRYLNITRAQK